MRALWVNIKRNHINESPLLWRGARGEARIL